MYTSDAESQNVEVHGVIEVSVTVPVGSTTRFVVFSKVNSTMLTYTLVDAVNWDRAVPAAAVRFVVNSAEVRPQEMTGAPMYIRHSSHQ